MKKVVISNNNSWSLLLLVVVLVQISCLWNNNNHHLLVSAESVSVGVDGTVQRQKSIGNNEQYPVRIINKSNYRADFYYEDNMYGKMLAIVEAKGGESMIHTFKGHEFFVTRHGVKEALFDPTTETQLRFVSQGLMGEEIIIPANARPSKERCLDRYKVCQQHAQRGFCESNPGWMIVHCCQSCDKLIDSSRLIDPKIRCTRDNLNMTNAAWQPGDLETLFQDWATNDKYAKYSPKVLSSPNPSVYGGGSVEGGPWVMIFDTFMTSDEADALIKGGQISGFQRSTDQGAVNALGEKEKVVSTSRTSSNAWCTAGCEALPGVQSITEKIEEVTGISRQNYESFQILEYGKDQFYRRHHDTQARDPTVSGPRILTFFLYLSDVTEGGETAFTELDIAVKPKKGRALVWPSVTNDDPTFWDARMYHEARDVIQGKKMAANHWIHLYDYRTPNVWGCTGSFA